MDAEPKPYRPDQYEWDGSMWWHKLPRQKRYDELVTEGVNDYYDRFGITQKIEVEGGLYVWKFFQHGKYIGNGPGSVTALVSR